MTRLVFSREHYVGATSDLFIASEPELESLPARGSPAGKLPGWRGSGVDLVMLSTLEGILTGMDWESVFDVHYMNPVKDDGPEGPWVYHVSDILTKALSKMNRESMTNAAGQWAETDEWTVHENNGTDAIVDVLERLAGLARQALAEKKHIFLWTTF